MGLKIGVEVARGVCKRSSRKSDGWKHAEKGKPHIPLLLSLIALFLLVGSQLDALESYYYNYYDAAPFSNNYSPYTYDREGRLYYYDSYYYSRTPEPRNYRDLRGWRERNPSLNLWENKNYRNEVRRSDSLRNWHRSDSDKTLHNFSETEWQKPKRWNQSSKAMRGPGGSEAGTTHYY